MICPACPAASQLSILDFYLETLFHLVTRLCHEAHLDDEAITILLEMDDRDHLEIITDTADEVLIKAQALIVEARLGIQSVRTEVSA